MSWTRTTLGLSPSRHSNGYKVKLLHAETLMAILLTFPIVSGRISSIRLSGSKLAFIDIVEDQIKLQVMLSYSTLDSSIATLDDFKNLCRLLRRGDYICKL